MFLFKIKTSIIRFSHQELKNEQELRDFIKENEEFIKENLEKYGNLKILPEYQLYLKDKQKLNINSNNNNIKSQLIHPGFEETFHDKEIMAKNERFIETPINHNIPLPIFQKILPNKPLSSLGYFPSISQSETKFNENMSFPSIKNTNINKNPFPNYEYQKHYEQEPLQSSMKFPPFINDFGLNKINYPIHFMNPPKHNMNMNAINMNTPNINSHSHTLNSQTQNLPNLYSNNPHPAINHNTDPHNPHKIINSTNHNFLPSPINNNLQSNHLFNNFQQPFNFPLNSKNMNSIPIFNNNAQPNPNFSNSNTLMNHHQLAAPHLSHFPAQNNNSNSNLTKSINNIINNNEMYLNNSFDNMSKINYPPMHTLEKPNATLHSYNYQGINVQSNFLLKFNNIHLFKRSNWRKPFEK